MAGDHGEKPYKFCNHVILLGTEIILRTANLLEMKNEGWDSHYGIVFKLNWM